MKEKNKNKSFIKKIMLPFLMLAFIFMLNTAYALDPVERTVTFEVLTYDAIESEGTFSNNTYQNINLYAIFDTVTNSATNIVEIKLNDVVLEGDLFIDNLGIIGFGSDLGDDDWVELDNSNNFKTDTYEAEVGDVWVITFLVEQIPQGTIIDNIVSWTTGFTTIIVTVFTALTPIFWVESTGLTLVGMLSLFAVGVGLIYLGLRFILQLFPGSHSL